MADPRPVVSPPATGRAGPVIVVRSHEDLLGRIKPLPPSADSDAHPTAAPTIAGAGVGVVMTVVLPVYNEAGLIERTFDAVHRFTLDHPQTRFLFVDDGSTDDTAGLIRRQLAATGTRQVGLISYPVNAGKGQAIRAGVAALRCVGGEVGGEPGGNPGGDAGGDPGLKPSAWEDTGAGAPAYEGLICFTDGDLAYSLDHLRLMGDALGMYDVVIGSRKLINERQKNIRFMRRLLGGGYNLLARAVLGLPHRDTQAGLKGFRAAAARRVFAKQRLTDFSFDVELVFVARRMGLSIAEIPAHVSPGHSYKVSKVQLLRDPVRMFWALWRIRWNSLLGRYD